LYKRADRIVVVTEAFKPHLIQHWHVPAGKIEVVENGVETDLFAPLQRDSNTILRRQLDLHSRFVVAYVGTIGMAHGLETLLDAAAQLQVENPAVLFLVIGEGAEKQRIQALAASRKLANVRFLDQQPREKIPAFISASDCCLVLLKKTDIFKTVIPTKMLEFMSCARPVILAVEGQARHILEEAQAGLPIEPENAHALASAIQHFAADAGLARKLGENGRAYILQKFSRSNTAQKYIHVLERVLSRSTTAQL
ncbi:MAG TPA: glycosyltransferase family 4 protein, partial [Candidatus Sulfotelmatobacter sp.]|nr:glycosyltransferase family 4 protein [Candidatus Sulfotelmatobacter sp.]